MLREKSGMHLCHLDFCRCISRREQGELRCEPGGGEIALSTGEGLLTQNKFALSIIESVSAFDLHIPFPVKPPVHVGISLNPAPSWDIRITDRTQTSKAPPALAEGERHALTID
jgi:hypothetical protein